MPPHIVTTALPDRDQLGEGPTWRPATGEMIRVDILRGHVHAWRPGAGTSTSTAFAGEVSAAVPRRDGGLVIACGHELIALDEDGAQHVVATVAAHPDLRFNDCRCDPQGRLWAGTMSKTRTPDRAALYRMQHGDSITTVIAPTTLSNGMGWSPQGDRMYFIDSTTQRIDVLDFDGRDGTVSGRRTFAEVPLTQGLPDGLTVDAEGGVWVCLFGGGALHRYSSSGALDDVIELPTTNPTCPAFGGPDLRTLFVTTARHRLTDTQLAREPLAGAVLQLAPGVAGAPPNTYHG